MNYGEEGREIEERRKEGRGGGKGGGRVGDLGVMSVIPTLEG